MCNDGVNVEGAVGVPPTGDLEDSRYVISMRPGGGMLVVIGDGVIVDGKAVEY